MASLPEGVTDSVHRPALMQPIPAIPPDDAQPLTETEIDDMAPPEQPAFVADRGDRETRNLAEQRRISGCRVATFGRSQAGGTVKNSKRG
ncbi:hypothetical protein RM530_10775 [Algiphilus sp. W345]|uniref:Uncharacterized protein n=1 Tax=Banduia mediterranea TaxID=3075609 RepID=A0ABU2WJ02_9GAMM|nr:hypothetical protein [Algiphilus sp. W345]MDT0497840.1 hypothetical protein [Algiphilus sp. W345]